MRNRRGNLSRRIALACAIVGVTPCLDTAGSEVSSEVDFVYDNDGICDLLWTVVMCVSALRERLGVIRLFNSARIHAYVTSLWQPWVTMIHTCFVWFLFGRCCVRSGWGDLKVRG